MATEFILLQELCQHSLSANGMASNDCTVIALLTVLRFLQCDLNIPKNGIEGIQSMLIQLREVMIKGNTLYSIINPPSHNPNLTVGDVLTSVSFPLEENPFAAVINFQTLALILETAIQGREIKKNSTYFHYTT